ncbi:hypothetical protein LXL04_001479 [Taraxacum kok-saghyz]
MSKASKIYDLPMPDFGGTTLGLRQEQRLILITASIFGRRRKDNSVYLDMKTNSHHLLPPSTTTTANTAASFPPASSSSQPLFYVSLFYG